MPKVTIDVPAKGIEESVRKELQSLKGKNIRLETKNSKLQQEIDHNKGIVERAKSIIDAVKEAGELDEWEPWGGC